MKKRNLSILLSTITTVAVLAINTSAAFAATTYNSTSIDANLNATVKPDHVTLTWASDPTTTQTITWRTSTAVASGVVQYVPLTGSGVAATSNAKMELFQTTLTTDKVAGSMNLFSTTLTGLTPGTKYAYRVGDGTNWSSAGTFTTEAANTSSFKFLVFGDSQSGNAANPEYTPWNANVQSAFNTNRDASFMINMGDLVENGQYYMHWNNWFDAAKGVIDTISEMPVQGNHETYNPGGSSSAVPSYYVNQFKVPQNGPQDKLGQVYSYNYGNAHFVVLDSQEDEEATGNDAFLQEQAAWLDNDLSNNKQKFTFVLFHKTPYYNKALRCNVALKDILTPIIEKHHVDVVFNGHDHAVSRTYPINNGTYYSSPSQGTVYYVTGRSGNKYYNDLQSKFWDANFFDPQDQPCYEAVQLNGNKLTINAYKQDGTKMDSYVIDKDNDANSTKTVLPSKNNVTKLVMFGNEITFGSNQAEYVNGKAYANPSLIASYTGGTYDAANYVLTIKGKAYTFTASDLSANKNISIDSLNAKGDFDCQYNSQFNTVMVDLKNFN